MTKLPFMSIPVYEMNGETQFLSVEESGFYFRMLCAAWMAGGYIPDNDEQIASALRVPVDRWLAARPAMEALFDVTNRGWCQPKMLAEIKRVSANVAKKRVAGKAGGKAKALKAKANQASTCQLFAEADALATIPITIPIPITTTKEEEESLTPSACEPAARDSTIAAEIPDDAAETITDKQGFAVAQGKAEADEQAPPKPLSPMEQALQEEMREEIRSKFSISKPKSTTSMTLAEYRKMYGEDALPASMRSASSMASASAPGFVAVLSETEPQRQATPMNGKRHVPTHYDDPETGEEIPF